MRVLWLCLIAMSLSACASTSGLSKINTAAIQPARPAPISCPPSGLKKIADNVYQTDEQGYQNLKACLSDTVRYVEQANGVITFYTSKK